METAYSHLNPKEHMTVPIIDSRLDVITLLVDDLPRAKAFYLDVFELSVHYEDQDSVVFSFGPTLVNLLATSAAPELLEPARPGDSSAGPRVVLTITVADVDAAAEHVVARGAALLTGPRDRPWGRRTASFRDPEGHVWELAK
jgi:catechol 2,3-dioxygenase-like lactoylglutathione lyase family enzyme